MKTLKRVILACIVLIAVLGLGVYFAIKIAFPPQKINELIHKYGSEALNRDVTVGDVSIHIFPNLMISVTEVNVANAPGFSKDPAIKLREIALSIDFFSLLRFSPVINEIKLVEPEILYETAKNGHNNLEGMSKPDTAKKEIPEPAKALTIPAAVALNSFVIENGKVRYRDGKTGAEFTLGRVYQQVSVQLDQKLENISTKGKLEITEISVSDPASGLKKGNIRVTLAHDVKMNLPGERVEVKSLALEFQDVRASMTGEITHFMGKPAVDLSLQAHDIHLASLLKEVPTTLSPDVAKLSVKGVASLDVKVSGVLDSGKIPDINAKVAIRDGMVAHKDLPASLENLNLDVSLAGDNLTLARFAFDMGGNPVSMKGLITSLRAPVPRLQSFDLDALLDLGKAFALLEKLALADKDMQAQGMIQAKIQAAGLLDPKTPLGLKAQGNVELRDVVIKTKGLPQAVKAQGQIKVDNDKITENLGVRIGQSDITLTGWVSNYLALVMPKAAKGSTTKVNLSVKSGNLNLDELLPGGEKKDEKETAPMTAWPSLPKADVSIDVKLAKTQFMNLAMTDFSSQTNLTGGVLATNLAGTLYSGGFTSSLKADLRDTTNADIDLKLNVKGVEANDFISRLNDRLPDGNRLMKTLAGTDNSIYGKITLAADLKASGLPQTMANNLTGAIKFSLANGRLHETGMIKSLSEALGKINKSWAFQDLTFSDFTTDLTAVKGKLLVKDAQIKESVVGSIAAQGAIGLDNALSLNLENHLPANLSKNIGGASSAVTSELAKLSKIPGLANASLFPMDKNGRAILYFLVGGTILKPEFSLDTKRMAAEAGSGVKSALEDAFKQKQEELKAKLEEEKAKLMVEKDKLQNAAKAKVDSAKVKAQEKAEEEKKKAEEEAKKQGKKLLKNIHF